MSFGSKEQSEVEHICLQHLVSSAYRKRREKATDKGRSLMYSMNNKDPSMLPCGTPDETGSQSEEHLFTTTHCFLLIR